MKTQKKYCIHISKKFWEELIAYFPSYDKDHIDDNTCIQQFFYSCVFVAMVMTLPNFFLPRMGGYTYRHRDCCVWGGFMQYNIVIGSGAYLYILVQPFNSTWEGGYTNSKVIS
jgi:hypothetical protein